jgi:hypothetical protein
MCSSDGESTGWRRSSGDISGPLSPLVDTTVIAIKSESLKSSTESRSLSAPPPPLCFKWNARTPPRHTEKRPGSRSEIEAGILAVKTLESNLSECFLFSRLDLEVNYILYTHRTNFILVRLWFNGYCNKCFLGELVNEPRSTPPSVVAVPPETKGWGGRPHPIISQSCRQLPVTIHSRTILPRSFPDQSLPGLIHSRRSQGNRSE